MIFDTHAHFDDPAFDSDREEIIRSLPSRGIGHVIDVGDSRVSMQKVKEIADTYPFIYGALGLHPDEVGDFDQDLLKEMKDGLDHDPKIVAVGEIGLDYHWGKEKRDLQITWFRRQAEIAIERDLPIIIHSRDAAEDTMEILTCLYGKGSPGENMDRKGVLHCYSYSPDQARTYTGMGFYLGIGGTVTFKNAKRIKKVVQEIPLTCLLLETDCPYLAPEPHRGQRNSSLYLPLVVAEIARLKGVTEREVEEVTWQNAMDLFRITKTL